MSQPNQFTTVSDQPDEGGEYIPMARCKGRLMIVRPLEYKREGFTTKHKPDGTDVVFCDIAVLDPIPDWEDEEGVNHAGFLAGHQFRNQSVLQGFLKGTFKRYIGATLIGTMYRGAPTKGKPPMMWQDLSTDPDCVRRGQGFMAAHPEFLIPVAANISRSEPEQETYGFQGYSNQSAPAGRTSGYSDPDPWATATEPSRNPQAAAQETRRPQTTLEQLRGMGQVNHQNDVQSSDPPF